VCNPFLKRKKKDIGRVAERKAAKRMGGRLQPNSGAMDGAKGDYKVDEFLVESKATEKVSFSLRLDDLRKIAFEALEVYRYPALHVQFVTAKGDPVKNGSWIVIRESEFKESRDAVFFKDNSG